MRRYIEARLAALLLVLAVFALAGFALADDGGGRVTSGVLTAPPKGVLPGRQVYTAVDLTGWRVVGVVVEDAAGNRHILPLAEMPDPTTTPLPTNTPRPTETPSMTPAHTPEPTVAVTPEDERTPSPTPAPTLTPTPAPTLEPGGCLVRSTANVNARSLPVVRADTVIGVLPAGSLIRITGYYVEQTAAATYIWYRYWYDVEHPDAWSRSDFFTARDDTPGCQLLPRVSAP